MRSLFILPFSRLDAILLAKTTEHTIVLPNRASLVARAFVLQGILKVERQHLFGSA